MAEGYTWEPCTAAHLAEGRLLARDLRYLKPQAQLPPSWRELQVSRLAGHRGPASVIMSAIIVPSRVRHILIRLCSHPGPLLRVNEHFQPRVLPQEKKIPCQDSAVWVLLSFHSFLGTHPPRAGSPEAFLIQYLSLALVLPWTTSPLLIPRREGVPPCVPPRPAREC